MFKMLIDFVFYIITKISSFIFSPIISFFTNIFPNLGTIIENIQYFLQEYLFNVLKFVKMFLINAVAFPLPLLEFLISVFTILVTIHATMLIYKGVLTLYQKLKP